MYMKQYFLCFILKKVEMYEVFLIQKRDKERKISLSIAMLEKIY